MSRDFPSSTNVRLAAFVSFVVLAVFVAASPIARAQSPTPAEEEIKRLGEQVEQLSKAGKFSDAVPLALRVVTLCEQALGPRDPATATGLNDLAFLYQQLSDYARAKPLYERA